MVILAGDIGGTKTLLQLSKPHHGGFEVLHEKRYTSTDYLGFEPIILDFVQEALSSTGQQATAACLGIAGPVTGRTAITTNLPWKLDADKLESLLRIPKVRLINDFQSIGYGIEALKQDEILTLQEGIPVEKGTRVIIGAGTGLGMGMLVWQHDHYEVVASEGGHSSFAPTDELQVELLRYLQKRYQWATWERAVSGHGLVNIFEFLVETQSIPASAALSEALDKHDDMAAVISESALSGQDALAVKALDIFVRIYGAQAGNLALLGLATGGVYVAGGIAPKIMDKLASGLFMQHFLEKDIRMQPLLKAMPVHVVANEHVGLLGAAVVASRL